VTDGLVDRKMDEERDAFLLSTKDKSIDDHHSVC